jgi:hypothetical protein
MYCTSRDIEARMRFESGNPAQARHIPKNISIKDGKVYYNGVPQGRLTTYREGKIEFKDWKSRKRQILIKEKF